MKIRLLATISALLIYSTVFGQKLIPYDSLIKQGKDLYKEGKYKSSLEKFEKAFLIKANNSTDLYNGACSAALTGNKKKAMALLNKSLDNGYRGSDHIQKDSDLYILHPLAEWKAIVSRTKQNEKQIKSSSEIIDMIISGIKKNNSTEFSELYCDYYKSDGGKQELEQTVGKIYSLLKTDNIETFNNLRSSTSSSVTVKDGKITENNTYSYQHIPKYFGVYTSSMFVIPVGYDITIELSKHNSRWQLDSLILENNYLSTDSELKKYMNELLTHEGEYNTKFAAIYEKKQFLGAVALPIKDLEFNLDEFQLQHQLLDNVNYQYESGNIYCLSIYKEFPKSTKFSAGNSSDFFEFSNSKTQIIEFAFYDNGSNIMLISNGHQYAFYKTNRTNEIKEIITKKLLKCE